MAKAARGQVGPVNRIAQSLKRRHQRFRAGTTPTEMAERNQTALPAPTTPDGRYIVVSGRLWRAANPSLEPSRRQTLVDQLMAARRGVAVAKQANDVPALMQARQQVDAAKHALGERGPVWWTDCAPDLNRHMVHTTPYAAWYAALQGGR